MLSIIIRRRRHTVTAMVGGGWRSWNGCPPGYTVQGGNCAPYQGPVGGPPRRWYGY